MTNNTSKAMELFISLRDCRMEGEIEEIVAAHDDAIRRECVKDYYKMAELLRWAMTYVDDDLIESEQKMKNIAIAILGKKGIDKTE